MVTASQVIVDVVYVKREQQRTQYRTLSINGRPNATMRLCNRRSNTLDSSLKLAIGHVSEGDDGNLTLDNGF
ncbi:hypothetical protein PV325_011865, partial [Microctonus aethiopoides]